MIYNGCRSAGTSNKHTTWQATTWLCLRCKITGSMRASSKMYLHYKKYMGLACVVCAARTVLCWVVWVRLRGYASAGWHACAKHCIAACKRQEHKAPALSLASMCDHPAQLDPTMTSCFNGMHTAS
jgi:hypothetical protein